MRAWICLAVAIVFLSGLAHAGQLKPWQIRAATMVQAEKKVLAAKWRDPVMNVLHVAVQPNGSRREGFAQYLCMLLPDAGAPQGVLKTIFIYDPASYKSGSGSAMGIAACR